MREIRVKRNNTEARHDASSSSSGLVKLSAHWQASSKFKVMSLEEKGRGKNRGPGVHGSIGPENHKKMQIRTKY